MTAIARLQIRLLGTLRVESDQPGAPLRAGAFVSRPLALLLSCLALQSPTAVSRSRLAGLLNPDQPEAQARRALTDALYRLRRELGDHSAQLTVHAETLQLRTAGTWLDTREFQRLAASSELHDWQLALDLYTGDLLEDLDAEWLLVPRAAMREQYLTLLERLCHTLSKANHLAEALACAHRWTLADSLNEQATRTAMTLYARLGRHAAALQQMERLRQSLLSELDAEPLPETRALAETIRAEYDAAQSLPVRPFVGRRSERAALLQCVEQANAGHGGLALVEGEPGIGKTRLLESLAEGAAWRNLAVVWGRARQLGGTSPFAPLTEALQAAIAGPRAEQLRSRVSAHTFEMLGPLLQRPQSGASPRRAPYAEAPSLPEAISETLNALAALSPHVLILDDVQWSGPGFWDVLRYCLPRWVDQRLLVVLGYRSEELRVQSAAWTALRELDQLLAPTRVVLDGLTAAECSALALALGHSLDEPGRHALYARTRGNPLFVAESIAHPAEAPASLQRLLAIRLARLSPRAREDLEAGAVLGREFTHGTWQTLAGSGLLDDLPALLHARFIEESPQGYRFSHDLTREQVYYAIAPERLRDWHRRAADALARERAEPAELAWHAEQAGEWPAAVRYYREAGERAAKAFAHSAALADAAHGLELNARVGGMPAEQLALLRVRARALNDLTRRAELGPALDALEALARSEGDEVALGEAYIMRVNLHVLDGNWPAMQQVAASAIALAERLQDVPTQARIHATLGYHLVDMLGQPAEALPHLQRATELAKRLGDVVLQCYALTSLALVYRNIGQCARSKASVQQALALAEGQPDVRREYAEAWLILAIVEASLVHWQVALEASRRSLALIAELDNPLDIMQHQFNYAVFCMRMGQPAEARRMLDAIGASPVITQLPPDSLFPLWVQVCSAEASLLNRDHRAAEQTLDSLRRWIEDASGGRAKSLALQVFGQLRLVQSRPAEALAPLARAVQLWRQAGRTMEAAPPLWYAIALARSGRAQEGMTVLQEAEVALAQTDFAILNVLRHFARFELSGQASALEAARAEIARQAALFESAHLRADFLNRVALNQEVEEAYTGMLSAHSAAGSAASSPITVLRIHLARTGAPLGRALDGADRVVVHWTVDAGPADEELRVQSGKAALRRQRILRLLDEARAQGATPTDADFAQALGVNTRTIVRDILTIQQSGHSVVTRRRLA